MKPSRAQGESAEDEVFIGDLTVDAAGAASAGGAASRVSKRGRGDVKTGQKMETLVSESEVLLGDLVAQSQSEEYGTEEAVMRWYEKRKRDRLATLKSPARTLFEDVVDWFWLCLGAAILGRFLEFAIKGYKDDFFGPIFFPWKWDNGALIGTVEDLLM
ncbi:unnamed protein product [Vitrella brassicaformis CCMP3155]|uniref:Uncharacterized protein n=1 Tax=Vitrella brassicaformis (strain CCMP3155) TaxID=1169540 RepID=A0A0G4ED09_VITBC|nr:unnamed protein product [Vitrella brassicaformis CCMP3155]|eukprot:CEL93561.1 unnamed protein product [Vitrella brassicaformis CCMP3155]